STGKTLLLHKGLQQQRPIAILLLPVCGQSLDGQAQDLVGQMAYLHPGQEQKPRIGDDLLAMSFARLTTPADPAVAVMQVPGGSAKPEGTQPANITPDQIADLGADQRLIAAVMVGGDHLFPQARLRRTVACDGHQLDGPQDPELAF